MILIWSNTGEWGGVDVLIMRFAAFLRDRGVEFVIAEPVGSRLRNDLPWAAFVEPHHSHTVPASYVFFPSVAKLRDPLIPWAALGDVPVFTWVVHPNDPLTRFVPLASHLLPRLGYRAARLPLRLMPRHRALANELFWSLSAGGALAFMDGPNRRAFSFFYPKVATDAAYMIPVPAPCGNYSADAVSADTALRIGYLGRMDVMKWSAIRPLIKNTLAPLAQRRPVKFIAVSEGSSINQLIELCKLTGVELDLHGFMPNAEARSFLRRNASIGVAMGTAVLDLAATGLPCIMIDPSVRSAASPQWRFRFVHEALEYSVGEFRDFPDYVGGLRSFPECLQLAENSALGEAGRQYVAMNHDPDRCFGMLHSAMLRSSVTGSRVGRLMTAIERSFAGVRARFRRGGVA